MPARCSALPPLLCLLLLAALAPRVQAQSFPETKLLRSDALLFDNFGGAVALSRDGTYALVAANGRESSRGRVSVYVRTGDTWAEQATLSASDGVAGDYFGVDVALSADGTRALIGAMLDDDAGTSSGSAYVFARTGDTWAEEAKLTASDAGAQHTFGNAVALSDDGTFALIGAVGADQAYGFARTGSAWAERALLIGALGEGFGIDVALSEDAGYALVGARFGHTSAGSAYVFERSGGTYTQQAELTAADGAAGDDFGWRLSLSRDGRYALVGARLDTTRADGAGSAYVFARTGSTWKQQAELTAADGEAGDQLGYAVEISADGARALAGALAHTAGGVRSGSAYLFARTDSTWTETSRIDASDGAADDTFGASVALSRDGRYALVGAGQALENGLKTGSAYVYKLQPPPLHAPYVVTLGSAGFDEGTDVGLDRAGNAYFAGQFRGTLDFDPGAGVAALTSTQADVYVASYDAGGAFRFAFPISNGIPTSEAAGGIAVTPAGDFAVTGSQPFGAIDFDPDPVGEALRTGRFFVAGYDAEGRFRFAVAPEGGSGANGAGQAAAIDLAGNVYVTGWFAGTINFAPGAPQPTVLTSAGGTDIFIASYDASGVLRSASRLGGEDDDAGEGIAVDAAGNVYVTGRLNTASLLKRGAQGFTGTPGAFLAGYAPDHSRRFLYTFGSQGRGEDVALDAAGHVTVVGSFVGTAAFDPFDTDNDGNLEVVTGTAGTSAFIASYTSEGRFRFVAAPTGPGEALGVNVLGPGGSVVTGTFSDTIDFGGDRGTGALASGAGSDLFVARYGPAGAFQSAFNMGGDGLNAAHAIATDDQGYVLLTGSFSNTTDFDAGAGVDERTSAGQNDLFMMKVDPERLPVAVAPPASRPVGASLSAAFPNPFGTATRLTLTLARTEPARATLFDLLGREVRVLYEGVLPAHTAHTLDVDAGALASGIYLVRVVTPSFVETRRVVLQR